MRTALHSFDRRITVWIQAWPAWLRQPMLAITNVGQPLTIILFACGLLIWSTWRHQDHMMIASFVVLSTVVVSSGLKLLLRRTRPVTDYVAQMMYQTFSFPSGHSAAATVGFGFLAYLAVMVIAGPGGVALALIASGFGLLVCVSRIYLGAHFPSDVLGGILLGLIGLSINVWIVRPLG